eukprot:CAMPEP_0181216046 /NCGR_PEP_ID=MMETSP1096-20121128/26359_1 /TAXON_ID=156174 ORGANISM="Chrysochromulina ericina, Strain CCMP281" /NCGR_SAMPLE_ID=MMETSP1096 /ASSEMBLY_ACC=CAM_ASM_000453 /LENGTH=386 /DNA_ID=CAMNT_0023307985 /DNA_START=42 /DNA_END=1202 /DNA_ORIENTATION=+
MGVAVFHAPHQGQNLDERVSQFGALGLGIWWTNVLTIFLISCNALPFMFLKLQRAIPFTLLSTVTVHTSARLLHILTYPGPMEALATEYVALCDVCWPTLVLMHCLMGAFCGSHFGKGVGPNAHNYLDLGLGHVFMLIRMLPPLAMFFLSGNLHVLQRALICFLAPMLICSWVAVGSDALWRKLSHLVVEHSARSTEVQQLRAKYEQLERERREALEAAHLTRLRKESEVAADTMLDAGPEPPLVVVPHASRVSPVSAASSAASSGFPVGWPSGPRQERAGLQIGSNRAGDGYGPAHGACFHARGSIGDRGGEGVVHGGSLFAASAIGDGRRDRPTPGGSSFASQMGSGQSRAQESDCGAVVHGGSLFARASKGDFSDLLELFEEN